MHSVLTSRLLGLTKQILHQIMHGLEFEKKKKQNKTKNPNKTSYVGKIWESLRNAVLGRRSWLFSEPHSRHCSVLQYLHTVGLTRSVADCLSEVWGCVTWKTSDRWGVGVHLWSQFWSPVLNFLHSMAEVWKLLGSLFAQCDVSLNYSRNEGGWSLDSSAFLNPVINYLMAEVGTWVAPYSL